MTTELNAIEWFDPVNVNHRMRSWFVVCLKGRMHQMIWSSRIIPCDQNDYRIECHRMIWPCECESSNAIMICRMTQRMHQIIWSSRIIQCDQNDYRIECHWMIWPCECESSNAIMICRMTQRMQMIWSSRIIQCDQNDYRIECHQMTWTCEPSKFESCDQLDFYYVWLDWYHELTMWTIECDSDFVVWHKFKWRMPSNYLIMWTIAKRCSQFFLELDNVIKTHRESSKLNFRMQSHVFFWMNSHHLPCSKGVFQTKGSADLS